jgi:hypothetical protein
MRQIDLREGARRQHRAISLFAVIQCWIRNLDGAALERTYFERLIGLKKFKRARVKWLQEDLKEFFQYQKIYWGSGTPRSFQCLVLCRSEFKKFLPSGPLAIRNGAFRMRPGGPKIELFRMWSEPTKKQMTGSFEGVIPFFADEVNYDERFLSSYLSLLVQGQISPHNLPPLEAIGGKPF